MYNVALVSGVQQSEPNTNTYIHFFKILFPYRPLQSIVPCAVLFPGPY